MTPKTIIIYKSKYGGAKKYAEWLAEDIGCVAQDLKGGKEVSLSNYDTSISLNLSACPLQNS